MSVNTMMTDYTLNYPKILMDTLGKNVTRTILYMERWLELLAIKETKR